MKLALVVPGGVDRSGQTRVIPALLALIERLARHHEVHVYAMRQEPARGQWPLRGATVYNMGGRWPALRALAAIVAEHRRAPFDRVQAVFGGRSGLSAMLAARWIRRPGLLHMAGGELVALPQIGYGGGLSWHGRLCESLTLRLADTVSAASAPVIAMAAARGIKAQRVPLGVDLRHWPVATPRPRREGPARLLHVASLNRVKDQATLLRALSALRLQGVDAQLDIVGEDTLQQHMQHLAQRLGLARHVRFLGYRRHCECYPLLMQADVLLISSLHEAGPLVVLEAAVAGVPTVGTAVGHIAEWAPDAACAVAVGDWQAMADAVAALLADDAWRLRMAGEAQRRAVREDADFTAACFEAMYARRRG